MITQQAMWVLVCFQEKASEYDEFLWGLLHQEEPGILVTVTRGIQGRIETSGGYFWILGETSLFL